MNKTYWFGFLFVGLVVGGCGSDSGTRPDTGTPQDATADVKADLAPIADAPAPADTVLSADATLPDAPVTIIDTATPVEVAAVDAPLDTAVATEAQAAVEAAAAEASVVDLAITESGGGEAGAPATYVAALSGAQEGPTVATSATGSAAFTLSADRTQLSYLVSHDVVGGTASHIHLGAAGENGAIIYPFSPFGTTMSGTLTITATDADNLEQGKLYVNVHSSTHPGGEIRGQILHPGDSLWVANLTGSQETPPVTSAGTGSAAVILDAAKTNLRYHVTTTGLTPTNAHIHKGIATLAGGVIYPFAPISTTMDGTLTITSADAQDLADGRWYVNVHTSANPAGELRGQLMQPGEVLYSAALSGASEVPPVTTSATGGAQFILDPTGTNLRYEAVFTGLTATAAHIHTGAVGVNGGVLYPLTLTSIGAQGTQAITTADLANLEAGNFYVNAHTAANPGGEIRGQIGKP